MRRRDIGRSGDIAGTIQAMLAGGIIAALLTVAVATTTLLCTLQFGPRPGDLLRFRPRGYIESSWKIPVRRVHGRTRCTLQPAVMAAGRGSLIVERRLADDWTYHVHWAGARTSDGAGDCGRSADLAIDRPALESLREIGRIADDWRLIGY